MSLHTTLSPDEAADRLAIRELVEAYAHCAAHVKLPLIILDATEACFDKGPRPSSPGRETSISAPSLTK